MIYRIVLIVSIVFLSCSKDSSGDTDKEAQEIEFIYNDVELAKRQAEEKGRLIFIDAYTDWCTWCKEMDKTTFSDKYVAKYYNQNFINLKLDMEAGDGPELGKKFNVESYPTLIFVDKDLNVIEKVEGYYNSTSFLRLGKRVK